MVIQESIITYYRDQPHTLNFLKVLDKSYGRPKGQVQAQICEFKIAAPNIFIRKKYPFLFEISFLSPANKSKRIFWVFAVHNQELLEKWLAALDEAKRIGIENTHKAEVSQKKLEEDIAGELRQRALREEAIKRAADLERRKNRQKDKLQDEEKRKHEIELEIRRLQLEAEIRRKQELLEKRHEKYQKLLENSWDYNFQKLWTKNITEKKVFEENLTNGFRLFKHVGLFLNKATLAVKNIVTEISLPQYKRQISPYEDGEIVSYSYQNMLIQLTMKTSCNEIWKTLGHEFRGNTTLFEKLYDIGSKKKSDLNIRVPLMVIVDYKGFRGLVTALAPLEGERTLVHGSKSDGVYLTSHSIYKSLSQTAEALNLKEHVFEWNPQVGPVYVHLSAFTECHKSLGYRDLEEYVQESMGKDVPDPGSLENHVYLLKLRDIFPPDYSLQGSPDFTKRLRPEYTQKVPIKLSPDCFINIHPSAKQQDLDLIDISKKLITEQVAELAKELDSLRTEPFDSEGIRDVFHSFGVNLRYLAEVARLSELSHIKAMMHLEIAARTCKNLFFQHVSEYIIGLPDEENEEIKRNLSETTEKPSKRTMSIFGSLDVRPGTSIRTRSETKYKSVRLPQISVDSNPFFDQNSPINDIYTENSISECAIDFFNLVFGNDEESAYFWDEILIPEAEKRFSSKPANLQKNQINLNGLLLSLCFHCSVFLSFTEDLQLGKTSQPFKLVQLQHISQKTKSFAMDCVEYKALSLKCKEYLNTENYSLALQACEMKLRISQALFSQYKLFGDPEILTEISEILIKTEDYENAMGKAKEALVQISPINAKSVRSWCVLGKALFAKKLNEEALQCIDNALIAIKFHWGEGHPLYITVYLLLAGEYVEQGNYSEALNLYKNALIYCFKILGPTHPRTGQVYSELANYYVGQGLMDSAIEVIEKAYFIFQAKFGKQSIFTVTAGVKYSEIMVCLGRYVQAEEIIRYCCSFYANCNKKNSNVYEKKTICQKFYVAALIGFAIGLKTNNWGQVIVYSENLWGIMSQSEKIDKDIVLQVLKSALEAKLNCASSKQKALVLNTIYATYKKNEEDIDMFQSNFNSQRFVNMVQSNGGLCTYLDKMIEKVCILRTRKGKLEENEESCLAVTANELRAILEISAELE